MAIEFWLTYNNGEEKLRLPVNPPSIQISSPHGFDDVRVAKLGEYTVVGDAELKSYSFSSFFPKTYNPSYCEYPDFPQPRDFIQTLERWRLSKKPMRLIIAGTWINVAVTLRDFNYDVERAGSNGDVYYEISFKEYKFTNVVKVERNETGAKASATKTRDNQKNTPKTYKVVKGDSLWKIAQKHLGNGSKWRDIYNLNKSVIGKNPDLIKPGQVLRLPS